MPIRDAAVTGANSWVKRNQNGMTNTAIRMRTECTIGMIRTSAPICAPTKVISARPPGVELKNAVARS